jgi:hypothetical protein
MESLKEGDNGVETERLFQRDDEGRKICAPSSKAERARIVHRAHAKE